VDPVRRHSALLRPEEELVLHGSPDRLMNVRTVVDEVGQAELDAVDALVGPLPAEADVGPGHGGALGEAVRRQPALGSRLDPRATLRHEPDLTIQQPPEPPDGRERLRHLGSGEHGLLIALEEGGVPTMRVARAVDDHAPDVDADSRDPRRAHGRSMRFLVEAQNYEFAA